MGESEKIEAVGYLRMSTDQQDTSIEQQKTEILARFGDKYNVRKWYIDEGKSGSHKTNRRIDFLSLLADARKGQFKIILCYDLSRFSRLDSIEGAEGKKCLRDNGVKLITAIEGEIDWTTSTGRIVDSVLSEAQHDFSVRLSNKSLLGKLAAAQKGKLYGQLTPYGLARLVTDSQNKQHLIGRTERFKKPREWHQEFVLGDPEEVAIVRWIFAEFYNRDVSFHQLAVELNKKGVKSPSGRTWGYQTIHQLLQNVRYAGDLSIGRDRAGEFHRIVNGKVERNHEKQMQTGRDDAVVIRNTHVAMIERELFDAVQVKVKRRWRTGKHSGGEEGFSLTGVLYCGHCGKPLYGNDGTNRSKSFKGIRYHCKGIHRNTGCGQWGVKEPEILPFMAKTLIESIDDVILRQHSAKPPEENGVDLIELNRKLEKLRSEYQGGVTQFLRMSEAMPELVGDLADQLNVWKQEIVVLENRIESEERAKSNHPDKLKKLIEWRESIRDKISLAVYKKRTNDGKIITWPYEFTTSTLRELLLKIECRVDLWWEKSSAKRYRIVRGRLRVGNLDVDFDPSAHVDHPAFALLSNCADSNTTNSAHFESNASLIVWCGDRKGRCTIKGWPGCNRPNAE